MPAVLLPNQPQLIQPADLLQIATASDLLAQFQLRPLTLQIVTGGALGTMTWQWQQQGDTAFTPALASELPAPFTFLLPDPGFGTLTFASGTYNANDTYSVSSAGIVTGGSGGGVGLITATRFNVPQLACIETVSLAVTWLQPRVVPPVLSIGPQILGWLADLVIYRLRSRQGMTPPDGGVGDDNVRARAKDAELQLKAIGASQDRPPDIVDSSASDTGAGFSALPQSDDLRGW